MTQLLSEELYSKADFEFAFNPENDSDSIKIEAMPGAKDLFNVSTWTTEDDLAEEGTIRRVQTVHLLGRGAVKMIMDDYPDVTPLIHRTLRSDGSVKSSETVFETPDAHYSLEDPRVLQLPDGRLFIGLTAVTQEGERWIPHPAVVVTSNEQLVSGLRGYEIVKNLGIGGQTTPISGEYVNGKNTTIVRDGVAVFRPEGPRNYHRLRVFGFKDGEASQLQDDIELPDNIPWATHKMGTTMPPVWLNDHEASFPIHGISKDQNGKDVYSIGGARLLRENDTLSIDNISQKPLIYPDLFKDMVGEEEVELRPKEKIVVYCVGGRPVYHSSGDVKAAKMLISVGDKLTFEVTVPRAKLTEGWPSSESIPPEQLLPEAA